MLHDHIPSIISIYSQSQIHVNILILLKIAIKNKLIVNLEKISVKMFFYYTQTLLNKRIYSVF